MAKKEKDIVMHYKEVPFAFHDIKGIRGILKYMFIAILGLNKLNMNTHFQIGDMTAEVSVWWVLNMN